MRTFIRLPALLIGLLAGAASPSHALSLGDATINSFIGEPLDVRIAVESGPDELLVASCVSAAVRRGEQNPPVFLPERRIKIEETLKAKALRLRAAEPFDEAIVRLQVRVTCAEQSPVTRDYLLVLDPRPVTPAAVIKIGQAVADNTAQAPAVSNAPATRASTPAAPAAPPSPAPVTAKSAGADKPAITNAKTAAPQGEFRLRLSGAELDLSRSRGFTEAMRGNLRDQQFILDADDQVVALLTLKNTVKQLESRLNQMQLKLNTQAQSLAAAAIAEVPEKSATAPAQAALPPVAQEKPVTPPVKSASRPTPPVSEEPWWTPPRIRLAPILVLVLGAAWWWLRRRRRAQPDARASASALPRGEIPDAFSDWANVSDSDIEPDPVIGSTAPQPAEVPRRASRREPLPPAVMPAHADVLDDMPASLELDMRPTTEVDFPLMVEESGEDKERRRRYIEMRYPEVANKTVTVDEPDSVIDAARQYFEEGQVQRAAELLTYAFEERPGQLRFWLALFEIYRLERMTAEFCELAAHFRDFHSGTDVWPKVQHIGRDLDPSNSLVAAALGRLGLPVDREFDAIAENWLNAPMDFTSSVLMAELRRSLLGEYGVDSAELQRLQPATAT